MEHLDLLLRWLAIDSTTGHERAYLEALEADLAQRGLQIRRQPVAPDRWNLWASMSDSPELLLCTHVDTVPPFFGPRVESDRVRARGACDTKGGLFAMVRAWEELPMELRAKVGFLLVVGEEVDHAGAIAAAPELQRSVRAVILCEPTQNLLASGQKGIVKLTLRAAGQAGHSAFPESGHPAVHDLVDACARLLHHSWPNDEELGPTTLNIGRIQGGVAANVFAPEAHAEVLFRAVTPASALEAEIRAVVGQQVSCHADCCNDPARLLRWAGFASTVVPFNTDAPYLQTQVPVVLVGPGDIRTAHSPDEHIRFDEIEAGIALYGDLMRGILLGNLAVPDGGPAKI